MKVREEIGKWLMDVAKYVATAVLISTFLGEIYGKTSEIRQINAI